MCKPLRRVCDVLLGAFVTIIFRHDPWRNYRVDKDVE